MKRLLPNVQRHAAVAALAATAAALGCGLAASAASASGELRWTLQNAYSSGCSGTGIGCTWLGYMTNPMPGAGTRGTVGVTAPAQGATVTPSSPRGANVWFTFGFPFTTTGSTGPLYTGGADRFEFEGAIDFNSALPPAGHGITMTVEDPRIELDGATGALYASGVKAAGVGATAPYDRTEPVFDLSLASATIKTLPDGSQEITGIVPSIHQTDYAFPGNYATGAGPDRTPNTFGSFDLLLGGPEGPVAPSGPQGPAGPAGPAGSEGRTITIVRRIQVVRLAKAPFGRSARKVRVYRRGKLVARGRVRGASLRVRLLKGAGAKTRLTGRYVLRVVAGKRRAVVRLG